MELSPTGPGGRAVPSRVLESNGKSLLLLALAIILGMAFFLTSLNTTARGQSECMLDCEQRYYACVNSQNPNVFCEEAYSNCADGCVGW
jgi:hypothetical protein